MADQSSRAASSHAVGGRVGSRAARHRVAYDLTTLRTLISNVCFVGAPGTASGDWVLVDAGVPGSGRSIVRAAEDLFGRGTRPRAILLTHGHFDHVGALPTLVERWRVPVYAHRLEEPYLTGRSPYPPPDPTVGGGLMARMAPLYPRRPIDLGERLGLLPEDGSVPFLPGWRWLSTPGHTAGHVSYFRESDRALVAGDAVITVDQESALDVLRQRPELSGPPAYFTQDWQEVRRSLRRLHSLAPETLITGHGPPLVGEAVTTGLERLLRDYEREVVPRRGRYVARPVLANEDGLVSVPPPSRRGSTALLFGLGCVLVAGTILLTRRRRRQGVRVRTSAAHGPL